MDDIDIDLEEWNDTLSVHDVTQAEDIICGLDLLIKQKDHDIKMLINTCETLREELDKCNNVIR